MSPLNVCKGLGQVLSSRVIKSRCGWKHMAEMEKDYLLGQYRYCQGTRRQAGTEGVQTLLTCRKSSSEVIREKTKKEA